MCPQGLDVLLSVDQELQKRIGIEATLPRCRWEAAIFEQAKQVMVLAMHIPTSRESANSILLVVNILPWHALGSLL